MYSVRLQKFFNCHNVCFTYVFKDKIITSYNLVLIILQMRAIWAIWWW